MNKKLWLATSLIVAVILLSGCVAQQLPDGSFGISVGEAGAVSATPVTAPEVGSQEPAGQPATTCDNIDFSPYVGNPYGLISLLDAQTGTTPQNRTSFTLLAEEALLYWTGNYNAGTAPSGFQRLIVDGDTGVFCVPSGTEVTVNFVGKFMPVVKFNSAATPSEVDDLADSCVPTDVVVDLLNTYAQTDGERLFRELDKLVNVEGAPYLGARFRPEPLEAKIYEELVPASVLMWTQTGQVGPDSVELAQSMGKSVYLNTEMVMEMTYPHTGLQLCLPLNPERDLEYWGN